LCGRHKGEIRSDRETASNAVSNAPQTAGTVPPLCAAKKPDGAGTIQGEMRRHRSLIVQSKCGTLIVTDR
jgi:hypothetical protein